MNEEEDISLFDYNIKVGKLDTSILDYLQNSDVKTTIPNMKFKLVSTNGCNNIKEMIQLALHNTNTTDILDVMIEAAPKYYVSSKKTTDNSYHIKFLEELEKLSKNLDNNIYYQSA